MLVRVQMRVQPAGIPDYTRMMIYTSEQLAAIEPESKPRKYCVGNGVHLYVAPSGLKSWRVRYRKGGREQMKALGRFPLVNREQAIFMGNEVRIAAKRDEDVAGRLRRQFSDLPAEINERIEHVRSIPAPSGTWVYFILAAHIGMVKIGLSANVEKRLGQLQTSHPYDLEIAATMPGGEFHEKAMHYIFSGHHERGEWFRYDGALRKLVEELC